MVIGSNQQAATLPRPVAPRWRDRRLVAGVVLVVASVLLGSRAVASADQRVPVWSVRHDLAAGTVLAADDLVPAAAGLDAGLSTYVAADGAAPIGRRLVRDIAAGELLPVAAVSAASPDSPPRRLVTVAVEPLHAPPGLARGERVDLYVTPREDGASPAPASRVLSSALVADVDGGTDAMSASDAVAVVLDVAASDAASAVSAVRRGAVDLVRVPGPSPGSP